MCGIVGYVGGRAALPLIMGGLARLEYRGYDSAGVAIQSPGGELVTAKKAGVLDNLRTAIGDGADLAGSTGMGHTRWATHGGPTDRNAHPHADGSGRLAVIHNGIIENFAALRTELESAGVEPVSDTDTEVVAHLLGAAFAAGPTAGDLTASMQAVCRRLHGTFTLVALHADRPGEIVAARRSSPLVLGVGDGAMFLASDVSAFLEYTRDAVELGQDQVVTLTADSYLVTDFLGNPLQGKHFHVDWEIAEAERGGYPTFMDKEIAEQPEALANTLRGHFDGRHILLDEQRMSDDDLRTIDKVFVVACGSAYHSGLVAKYAIEHWARLPVEVELASEFRYRDPILDRATLVVAVSQSGETMDTLEALRHARRQKATVLAVCNTNGAQIPRESDAVLYTHAGPEIGVASTKAFLAQVAANYLLGLALAQARGTKYPSEIAADFDQLAQIPDAARATLAGMDPVRRLGHRARRTVPRAARRLSGCPGGRAQAEGTRLHARRGLRGRRAEARAHRAGGGRTADGDRDAVGEIAPDAAPQDAVEYPRGAIARGAHHRHRRRGGRYRRAVRGHAHRCTDRSAAAATVGGDGAAADPGGRNCPRPRLRHRQTP